MDDGVLVGDHGPEKFAQIVYRLVAAVENLTREVTAINIKLDTKYVTHDRCMLLHEQRKQQIESTLKNTRLDKAEALAKIITLISVATSILWFVFSNMK